MIRLIIFFMLFVALHLLLWSCNPVQNPQESEGKALATQYCQGCHLLPEPNHLDKNTWQNHVLPKMGHFLGFYKTPEERQGLFENNPADEHLKIKNIYPEKPLFSEKEWLAIQEYFIQNAPEKLTVETIEIEKNNPFFNTIITPNKYSPPSTTLFQFKTNGGIYFGDAHTQQFIELNQDFSIQRNIEVEEGAVCINEMPEQLFVTFMGSFSPTDNPKGIVASFPKQGIEGSKIIIDNLRRPVDTKVEDLNLDGLPDFVIAEFGKFTGCLAWHKNLGNGQFEKNILWDKPGATKIQIIDMNQDGLKDIIALFAQADEGIDIYYNLGKGSFKRERVLSFPPSNGSSSMRIQDFNNDNHPDIVYTAGDNADFLPILKPYHGIYLFENDTKNQFKQTLFLPLNGAYSALIHDFDQDGKQDIAAISFFPDFKNQIEQGFVFFHNQGKELTNPKNFKAYSFPQVNKGRWILMDAGDFDKDGDLDIGIGSLIMEVVPKMGIENQWIQDGIPFLILENKVR